MKPLILLVVLVVIVYSAYEIMRLVYFAHLSRGLVLHAEAFERTGGTRSLLVLGDSTAVGVGAEDAAQSVAGRLSNALDASVENYAKSGAVSADIASQLARAKKGAYDVVLVQVGANDVIDLHDPDAASAALEEALVDVRTKSEHVVLLTSGKIGEAPLFPWFVRSYLTRRAADLRERFKTIADKYDAVYVDLYAIDDPFASDPERYYAPDGLHLTGDGYGFWYAQVNIAIEAKWPDLYE